MKKLPIKFMWSIEIYTVKDSNDLFLASFAESEEDDYSYHCEVFSKDKIKSCIDNLNNKEMNIYDFISETIINECFIGSNDDVEEILNIQLDKYIGGWDSSYYEEAVYSGANKLVDYESMGVI